MRAGIGVRFGTGRSGSAGVVILRQFLLKLHGRCNLSCSYCYVYEAADQSWRAKPRRMESSTVRRTAERIAEYQRGGDAFSVILHGGEPLLVGSRHLDETLRVLRGALGDRASLWLQTNGILLRDPEILRVLRDHGVRVGVSVDGSARDHDRNRRFGDGRGSHRSVVEGIAALRAEPNKPLYAGVLCTVDLASEPVETYEALLDLEPPRMDLLLPHGNWSAPPPGLPGGTPPAAPPVPGGTPTPYADWLCAVFDRWYRAPRRETGIRLFEELIMLILGGRAASELVGTGAADLVVVETDGTLELADSLKIAYDGAAATGLDVVRNSFDEVTRHPAFVPPPRAKVCGDCALERICGGGLHAHRYRAGAAEPFVQPTVYCQDMAVLIAHIRDALGRDVAALRERKMQGAGAR
ncbi:FxsB family cyclophane-forming radical SAM/SPASM peptide maturase [Streptomyces sp. NPDC001941]|uniref:FxsB family cyclophane-forming radical SAM/SPASM peptide maturase n=1 Tax=Streptomyces sp. NPDC001941 TaxID=3154659 RepID=UPI00332F5B8B